jgi:hypothetical protein
MWSGYGLWCFNTTFNAEYFSYINASDVRLISCFPMIGAPLMTTYAISAYRHLFCEFESRSGEVYSKKTQH